MKSTTKIKKCKICKTTAKVKKVLVGSGTMSNPRREEFRCPKHLYN